MRRETPKESEITKRTQRVKYAECQYCGKKLTQAQISQRNRYCSRRCFCNAQYGKMEGVGGIETHSAKLLKAVELYLSGETQTEAARMVGLHRTVVSSRIRKYGMEVLPDRVCEHCGKTYPRTSRCNKSKYCSDKCGYQARYLKRRQQREYKRTMHSAAARMGAMELYRGGLGGSEISRATGIAQGTISYWIHRFGSQRERELRAKAISLKPKKAKEPRKYCGQYPRNAQNTEEWIRLVRELPGCPRTEEKAMVNLVCGTTSGHGEVNVLASIVADRLRLDPLSGEVFAFCDKGHNTVSTLQWVNGGFSFTKTPILRGGYIWPAESLGDVATITTSEFSFLLTYRKNQTQNR